jgi:membrane protease YdiL (CAAX protease family)
VRGESSSVAPTVVMFRRLEDLTPWIHWLRPVGWRTVVALYLLSAGYLGFEGRLNLALIAPIGFLLTVPLMTQVPRRLPKLNWMRDRDLAVVLREVQPMVVYALIYPLLALPLVLYALDHHAPLWPGWPSPPIFSLQYLVADKIVLMSGAVLMFAIALGRPLRQLGLRRVTETWRWVGPVPPMVLLFLAISVLTVRPGTSPGLLLALTFVSFLYAGFPEEAFYRSMLQTRLELLFGTSSGIALSSLLFGLRHLPGRFFFVWLGTTHSPSTDFLLTLAVILSDQVVVGVMFGYMWHRYRNIYVNMAAHSVYDAVLFVGLFS